MICMMYLIIEYVIIIKIVVCLGLVVSYVEL